jgi:hypothetical protein
MTPAGASPGSCAPDIQRPHRRAGFLDSLDEGSGVGRLERAKVEATGVERAHEEAW